MGVTGSITASYGSEAYLRDANSTNPPGELARRGLEALKKQGSYEDPEIAEIGASATYANSCRDVWSATKKDVEKRKRVPKKLRLTFDVPGKPKAAPAEQPE